MTLLGFMVVTGMSQSLQFQVVGTIQGMNSNVILTVSNLKNRSDYLNVLVKTSFHESQCNNMHSM